MAKVALLIGVSEYEPGLNPLPAAVKDIEALRRVLQDPEMGGFDQVKTLANPDRQTMESEIESLFDGRAKEDLVLLFFSGHGIKDDASTLYFASRNTRKSDRGDLIRSTAVETRFVHNIMNNSRAKRQAIILDCCFSGAFDPAFQSKDDGSVDLQTQLGAEGRVVLTSSSSTQYSFEQQGSELSIYTRYLVEGIETGAGDSDSDGFVSMLELHEYAASKVRETAPKMTPKIIVLKDKGFEIFLAKARVTDPKLKYRKTATRYANAGTIRPAGRAVLNTLRQQLGLTLEETTEIEAEVLRPYQERLVNLKQYRETLIAEAEHEYPLGEVGREDLNTLQQMLGLRDEDVLPAQQEVEAQFSQQSAAYQQNLVQYEQALTDVVQQEFPLSQKTCQELRNLQQSLGLGDEDVAQIEQPICEPLETKYQEKLRQQEAEKQKAIYQKNLQQYERELTQTIQTSYPLGSTALPYWKNYQQSLKLKDEDVERISRPIFEQAEAKYQENLKQQEETEQQRQRELEERRKAEQEKLIQEAEQQRREQEEAEYENKLRRYEQEFAKAIQAEYPLNQFVLDRLKTFQQQLGLKDGDAAQIEQPISRLAEAKYQDHLQQQKQAEQRERELQERHSAEQEKLAEPQQQKEQLRQQEEAIQQRENQISDLIEAGDELYNQGKFDEAIAAYREVLQIDPNNIDTYNKLGDAFHKQGKLDEAIIEYQKALKVDPNSALAYANLGCTLVEKGRVDDAIAECQKAIQIDPNCVLAHHNMGYALGKKGRKDDAILSYQRAIQLDPHHALSYNNLGLCLGSQGKMDEEITAYRKAIQLDPDNAIAYNNLGLALRGQGKLEDAIAACRKAIQLDPNLAIAYNNLGFALRGQGKLEDAIAAYRKAIQLDPDNATTHTNLGVLYQGQGNLEESIATFRKVIEIDPNRVDIYNALGINLCNQKKLDEAIVAFRKAIQIDPDFAIAYQNLGIALDNQGKREEANKAYQQAEQLGYKRKKFLGLFGLYHRFGHGVGQAISKR